MRPVLLGPLRLGLSHAAHHPARSLILVLCVAVSLALPISVRTMVASFRAGLVARADATPLLIGAKGNRFDLTMSLLYFRRGDIPTMSMSQYRGIQDTRLGTVIPMHVRFTARGRPVVATTPEYYELRVMRPAAGSLPQMIGDATIGGRVAREIGLGVGSEVYSDQREVFDIAKPQALRLHVVGVLPEKGLPEDEAIFVDIKTAWILEGLSHAHVAVSDVPKRLVIEADARRSTISEEMIDDNRVTAENAQAFHLHADESQLPLTGLIVVPGSEKDGTILASRLNSGKALQAVQPLDVVRDLIAYVLRLQVLLDGVSLLVGLTTLTLLSLVTVLSVRVRSREIETYFKIGASRGTVALIFASELALVIALGAVLAIGVAWVSSWWGAALVKLV